MNNWQLPISKRFIWAHGGLGMHRLSSLLAPYNHLEIVHNEYFFRRGKNVYCDHADHLWNKHRNEYHKPTVKKYKEMLEHFKSSKHVIIHEDGWGQYASILRILKHILNVPQYSKYKHIKVSDAHRLQSFIDAAQEIVDNDFIDTKFNSISRHYKQMSHNMKHYGLEIYDISYKQLYIHPKRWVFEEIFEHMDIPEREYADYNFIIEQIESYHKKNVELVCENIPNIAEKLHIFLDNN